MPFISTERNFRYRNRLGISLFTWKPTITRTKSNFSSMLRPCEARENEKNLARALRDDECGLPRSIACTARLVGRTAAKIDPTPRNGDLAAFVGALSETV